MEKDDQFYFDFFNLMLLEDSNFKIFFKSRINFCKRKQYADSYVKEILSNLLRFDLSGLFKDFSEIAGKFNLVSFVNKTGLQPFGVFKRGTF